MNRPTPPSLLCLLLAGLSGLALACRESSGELEVAYTTINGVQCREGTVACGTECVHLDSDASHCGACNAACSGDELCDLGSCKALSQGCSEPRLLCGSDCVDALADRQHCGACAQACPAEASCRAGECACPEAQTVCGDGCVDTLSDEQHCGGCDQACADTQTCVAGSCECPAGTELCGRATLTIADNAVTSGVSGATCVDTASSNDHCGGCGIQCRGGQQCEAGSCECPQGGLFCTDRCVNAALDSQNCGACGNVCNGGQVCMAGSCACPAGQELCDGQCVDTQSNPDHCGSCGVACTLGQGCSAGACQSGALGEDGCQGLVSELSISQVSVYQTVESVIARNGAQVAGPTPRVVAGRPTLVRAFVTPQANWVQREVSGRLFLASGEEEITLYSRDTLTPAAASQQNDRASTLEFFVPPESITPDTRLALELVECDAAAPGTVSNARFPATSTAELGAVDTGGLRIHIVPLRANGELPDTSEQALNLYRALFLDSYPIANLELTVGAPLDITDAQDWGRNLDTVRALRQRENAPAEVYYYGMLKPTDTFGQFCGNGCVAGIGYIATGPIAALGRAALGLAYADLASAFIMLHEVGHNHGREHAPCVPPGSSIADIDPNFPQADGTIGTVGYNALGDQLLAPASTDVMGYCANQWFSAYTYQGLMDNILQVNNVQASQVVDPARVGGWDVMLADATHGLRWGEAIPGDSVAMGDEERALVLDASGAAVATVSVYRTRLSELDASSIQVPRRKPGWSAIQLSGTAPLAFPGAR